MKTSVVSKYSLKTNKKNKIFVEEVNPRELLEIWDKLGELKENL